jgi:DNA-binding transcriptional MerR regulator
MLKIGDFAKLCGTCARTLRYYDDEGVLKADLVDEITGYRFYSPEAVEKYKKLVFYKDLGFSLQEIKKLLAATEEEEKEMLKQKKGTLLSSVEQIQGQVQTINTMFARDEGKKAF